MPPTTKVALKASKPCKGSVRYSTDSKTAPVRDLYLMRSFAPDGKMPDLITITIEAPAA